MKEDCCVPGFASVSRFTTFTVEKCDVDGSVNVVFYDRRGLSGSATGVTVARSVDGGATFRNYRVAIEPFSTRADVFLGDYIGIDALGGKAIAMFPVLESERTVVLTVATFEFSPR